jgi:hypothetical protein
MKVLSRRVRDRSMSSTPAMPLAERGGAAESRVELLRSWCCVKGLVGLELKLEPRDCGRRPAKKDMSGSERGRNKVSGRIGCMYCGGRGATRTLPSSVSPSRRSSWRTFWSVCSPRGRARKDWPRCCRGRGGLKGGGARGDGQTNGGNRSTWKTLVRSRRAGFSFASVPFQHRENT